MKAPDFRSVLPNVPLKHVLWVVDAKNGAAGFIAGLEVCCSGENNRVVRAAPVIGYMTGWPGAKVEGYVAKRGWKLNKYG